MIRIGSRGSQLALWQANHVAAALRNLGHQVSIEIIRTTGDRLQNLAFSAIGSKGMFTREIEDALLANTIDIAVHSLKDLPTVLAEPFTIAAIPPRADPRDAFVSERYGAFADLPLGAAVGTSSVRRQALLRALRPELHYIEFRGNVDTRLRKLAHARGDGQGDARGDAQADAQADAIVLAAAGLDRLGRTEWVRERFPPEVLCPAPGQGALAIECRIEDTSTRAALEPLNHPATKAAVTQERVLLELLGGGCQVPIGAYCWQEAGSFTMRSVIAAPGGSRVLSEQMQQAEAGGLGRRLAQQLLARGAGQILGVPASAG